MKKTSVYLTEEEVEGLRRLAEATGRAQAELVRDAVGEYVARNAPKRRFLSAGAAASKRTLTPETDLDDEIRRVITERVQRERE